VIIISPCEIKSIEISYPENNHICDIIDTSYKYLVLSDQQTNHVCITPSQVGVKDDKDHDAMLYG
jgi:hypothetical protein